MTEEMREFIEREIARIEAKDDGGNLYLRGLYHGKIDAYKAVLFYSQISGG